MAEGKIKSKTKRDRNKGRPEQIKSVTPLADPG
jgi:hypothetical protein